MSEMIERVARAICLSEGFDPDFNYDPNGLGSMGGNDVRWKLFISDANAAIEAMREPTEAMIEKGSDARRSGNSRWGNSHGSWKAMIDEALK